MVLRVVLFDLDGVVRRFDPDDDAAIETRHSLPAGALHDAAFDRELLHEVTSGRLRWADWVGRVGDRVGSAAAAAEWGRRVPRTDDGVVEIAAALRRQGVRTAILTNGTDRVPAELAAAGLDAVFAPVFNSAEIGLCKPDPRLFAQVLNTLGVAPGDVLFVDDSTGHLPGADQLGMRTHLFESADGLREALRDEGVTV